MALLGQHTREPDYLDITANRIDFSGSGAEAFRIRIALSRIGDYVAEVQAFDRAGNPSSIRKSKIPKR